MRIFLWLLFVPAYSEINTSSELNCDFSTTCRWRNSTDDNSDWALSNKVTIDGSHSIMPISGDESQFLYTQGIMGRTTAVLISDVVSCQLGGANLKYWYYKTGQLSQLQVCIRQPPGSKEPGNLKCYDGISSTHAQQWIFRIIELPPSSQPFELLFQATFYPPMDIIALDDIVFDAALCEIANDGANQGGGGTFTEEDSIGRAASFLGLQTEEGPNAIVRLPKDQSSRALNYAAPTIEASKPEPAPTPRIGPLFKSMCAEVDCTFDEDGFCNYVTSKSDSLKIREWRLSSQGVLNTLTGIPQDFTKDGSFLFAEGENVSPRDTFVLSTKNPFNLKEAARLDFFVYQAGVKGRLSVCFDTTDNCGLILDGGNITADARKWKNYHLLIEPDVHAVHFVADQLQKNYVIGLDNIQLLNKFGTSSLTCSA